MSAPQSFKNHARFVPGYHGALAFLLLLNFAWALRHLWQMHSPGNGMAVLNATALLLLFFYARTFALTMQDRVIRLEMRLRLAGVLPADLAPRIQELTINQLVSLRFAGDAELPALTRKVLEERLDERKVIKQLVREWQADELRV